MQMRAIHSVISHVEGEGFVTHAPGSVFEIDDATAADLDARGAAYIVDASGSVFEIDDETSAALDAPVLIIGAAGESFEREPEAERPKRGRKAQVPDADASATVDQADASDASEDQPDEATE